MGILEGTQIHEMLLQMDPTVVKVIMAALVISALLCIVKKAVKLGIIILVVLLIAGVVTPAEIFNPELLDEVGAIVQDMDIDTEKIKEEADKLKDGAEKAADTVLGMLEALE